MQENQQVKTDTVKWFQGLLVIAVVLLGAGYLFRIFTPTQVDIPTTIETNYQGTTTSFEKVAYIGIAPTFPSRLAIGTAENLVFQDFNDQTLRNKIVSHYNLQQHPDVPELWVSSVYSLQVASQVELYEVTSLIEPPVGETVNLQAAITAAQEFTTIFFPNTNLVPLANELIFREADVHGDIVEQSEAEMVEIPFGYEINTYPVYLEKTSIHPVTVIMNADNEVQKAIFQTFIFTPKLEAEAQTINISQAVQNINNNQATIISSYYEGFEKESLASIKSGALTHVFLEYRISKDTKKIVPYYRFLGQLINQDGLEFSAVIITPAVQTQTPQP